MKFINNWLSRHRNPMSFWIHMVAIPCTFILPVALMIMEHWLLALLFFVGGYAMQFVGHLIEGNRSGEEELVRRLWARFRDRKKDEQKEQKQGTLPFD